MADANLGIKITAKDDGSVVLEKVAKSLKSVSVSAKQMEADVARGARSLDGALNLLKGSIGSLGIGLGVGSVVALGKSFVDAASQAQGFETRLRVILGSQAEATKLFGELERYAARTPFQLSAVVESATSLAGVLENGAADVVRWLPLIGDLAAMSGLTIQETTGQVTRMYSAGAASADLFRERGVLAMLGFQSGVTYSAEETRRKLQEAWTSQGSIFRGATEQMSQDWAGKVSNMADAWDKLKRTVGERIIENPTAVGGVEWLTEQLTHLADDVIPRLTENMATLQSAMQFQVGSGVRWGMAYLLLQKGEFAAAGRLLTTPVEAQDPTGGIPAHGATKGPFTSKRPRRPQVVPPETGPTTEKSPGPFYSMASWPGDRSWAEITTMGEVRGRTAAANASEAGVRAQFAVFEEAAKSAAQQGEESRKRLVEGNAENAARSIELDRQAFAAWEAAAQERAQREEQDRQDRLAGVIENNQKVLDDEKKTHESEMGLIRARAEAERQSMRDRNAALLAGVQLTGQVAGQTAALFRQLYEDSGGQAERYWEYYKAAAMAEATVATAQGIINVWAGPLGKYPPAAIAMSAVVGALGAAQVSLISQQQPAKAFAFGGIATGPTNALIGEAGPEAVIPLDRLPRLLERTTNVNAARQIHVTVNAPVESAAMDPAAAATLVGVIRREAYGAVRRALTDDPVAIRAARRAARG